MGPRGSETEDGSKFAAIGIDLCEVINVVTADDWRKGFEYLEREGVLSEREALVGGQIRSPVLHITADSDDSVQDPEVQTDSSEEEEIRFLACCNGKQ
jgi:hypothetical protein